MWQRIWRSWAYETINLIDIIIYMFVLAPSIRETTFSSITLIIMDFSQNLENNTETNMRVRVKKIKELLHRKCLR